MPTDPPRRSLWNDGQTADYGWLHEEPTLQQPAAAPPPPPAPKKRRTGAIVATSLAFVVIAAGAVAGGPALVDQINGSDEEQLKTATSLPAVTGKTPATRAKQIYDQTKSGVVQIRAGSGSGTGFVIDSEGTIVTNNHVVGSSKRVGVIFDDGAKTVEAEVLGTDVSTDLAVVRVNPADVDKLVPLALADSDKVNTGEEVLAIGYPLGLDRTATSGIVSGLGRSIKAENNFSIDKVIQTDASINPGNSGGPLLDGRGRVIGVNSQIAATAAGGNTGIGFAIPSNTVREIIPALVNGTSIKRPYLGVELTSLATGPGALVASVTRSGPADDAGIRGSQTDGDVITAIDGEQVADHADLIAKMGKKKVGQKVTLDVERNGKSDKVEVTLGERPANLGGANNNPVTPQSPQKPTP